MRFAIPSLALVLLAWPAAAQQTANGPTDEKAQKTYKHALEALRDRRKDVALDDFKKADKQDGSHCLDCQKQMYKYGLELAEWKTAEQAADEMLGEAHGEKEIAIAHFHLGVLFLKEGQEKHKDDLFSRAHDEAGKALASVANFPDAVMLDGRALAQLKQDDAAKACFEKYIKLRPSDDPDHQRALRFIERPELARARMAPAFAVTTFDGQHIAMDDLQGKVVLLDFWATWCGPCREALPHIQNVAKKFQGQPLVILSVSLDSDEQKWKDFIIKNEMTWPQYRDGGFAGNIAKMFSVTAIPHTFTIDADGVLQEEHVGDASIEGKIKKLLARAQELQSAKPVPASN